MEDLTGNSASNPDEFLNNLPASAVSSTMSVDETETRGAGDSSSETLETETGSVASNIKASDELVETSSEGNSPPATEAIGDAVLSEQVETVQCKKVNSQDENIMDERNAQNDDSGTEEDYPEEDSTQGYLQLSENNDNTSEVSATKEDLNTNLSEKTDISAQCASDVDKTSEIGSTSEQAVPVDEGSDVAVGNKDKTESAESATDPEKQVLESLYHIKWIKWKGINTPIITQNENGPCPLLAIVNVLLLQRRINIPSLQEIVTSGQLMEYIGDCILEESPKRLSEGAQLNYEQNMHDAIAIMNKLQTGLDVNVKFTGVSDFEFTPECIVFDLLSIGLYHGWLVDPQNTDTASAVGGLSYNQLVEKIIASKQEGAESQLVSEGLIGEAFLEQTASQLTYHGLCELNSQLQDDQLCVFFRNNHFSTFHKHKDELFLLVTDQGFLTEDRVIWESLANVEGDSYFVDAEFKTLPAVYSTPEPAPVPTLNQQLSQEDQDYLVALSLAAQEQDQESRVPQTQVYPGGPAQPQPLPSQVPPQQSAQSSQEWSDLQLAIQLQEEERRQQQQLQQQQQRRPQQARASPSRSSNIASQPQQHSNQQRAESSDKCIIL